jgi:hypothetical protein
MPKSSFMSIIKQPPDPFNQEGDVHDSGIHDPKATLVLRLADLLPIHPVLLAFLTSAFPKKTYFCAYQN